MLAMPLGGSRDSDLDSEENQGDYVPPGISLQNLSLLHSEPEEEKHASNLLYGGIFRHGLTWADAAPEDAFLQAMYLIENDLLVLICAVQLLGV